MDTAVKHPVPDRVKPSFEFLTSGTMTLRAEGQSAQMSSIASVWNRPHGMFGRQ